MKGGDRCKTCTSTEVRASGYCLACYNVEWRMSQDRESNYQFNVVYGRWRRAQHEKLDRILADLVAGTI